MADTKHLLESVDNIGYPSAWCDELAPSCSEDLNEVNCVPCLRAFLAFGEQVSDRLDEILLQLERTRA